MLFYREHKSVETVARELDLSADAVKQRLSRGRALLHEQVLALVESTLERTNPGRKFTRTVLSALPLAEATVAGAAAGATAAKSSTAAKAASSAGGAGFAATVLGLLAAFGGYIGWQMGDTRAQTSAERAWIVQFWRVVVASFVLFLLPAFVLPIGHRTNPRVLDIAMWWLELFYAAIIVGYSLYAWRGHRRRSTPEVVSAFPSPVSRKRLLTWVGLGTLGMAAQLVFLAFDYGGWHTTRLTGTEAPAFIAAHPAAKFYISEYQTGDRYLSTVVTESGHRSRFIARLDENTRAALKQSGVPVQTLVQGRDFEVYGWPGRLLFVPAILIVAAGVVLLARVWRGEKRSPELGAPATTR